MRILFVTDLLPFKLIGGLARHCITLGNYFLDAGHIVHLMGNSDYPIDSNMDFKGKFIPGFGLKWTLDEMIHKYVGVYPYPLYRHFSKNIAKAINRIAGQYDVVHYHGQYPMVANFIPKDTNFVQTRHDLGTFCLNKHFFRFSEKILCKSFTPRDCANCFKSNAGRLRYGLNKKWCSEWRTDTTHALSRHKIIFPSERSMNMTLRVLGINRTSIMFVSHNFIDSKVILSKIDTSKNLSFVKDNEVLIASTLHPPKGVYSFLKAYKEKGCNFPVTVVGRGSELPFMRDDFKQYHVKFLGWLSHENVIQAMVLHKVFVVTSLCEEIGPITAIEAMFLNKTVFALSRGGILELKSYARNKDQVRLYDSMEELVKGLVNYLAEQQSLGDIDLAKINFGGCVSKRASEILGIYEA